MGCECEMAVKNAEQARVLRALLAINAAMFLAEGVAGWLASSTGLIADSLDMFADAAVYGVSLYAVGRSCAHKAKAAYLSGVMQLALGLGVAAEVVRRLLGESEPRSMIMLSVGAMALIANVACLALLSRQREGEVHMRASWIFSANDVLANLGVILAGALVAVSGSALPDLVIGSIIAAIVLRGGVVIVKDARKELRATA